MINHNEVLQSLRLAQQNAATLAQMAQRQTELTEQLAAARRRADIAEVLAVLPLVYGMFRATYLAMKAKPAASTTATAPQPPKRYLTREELREVLASFGIDAAESKGV